MQTEMHGTIKHGIRAWNEYSQNMNSVNSIVTIAVIFIVTVTANCYSALPVDSAVSCVPAQLSPLHAIPSKIFGLVPKAVPKKQGKWHSLA